MPHPTASSPFTVKGRPFPTESFQLYMLARLRPSMTQPPGKRRNDGFSASRYSPRSFRMGRPLYVSFGIRDTMST